MPPRDRAPVPDVARVESELAELWRSASDGDEPVMRACTLNLVVACDDGSPALDAATRLVARVSETEPGRAVVVAFPEEEHAADGLSVYVSAHCHRGAGGKQVCCEQITLEARGAGHELVPATVLQLLVGDLPVYTLWLRRDTGRDPLMAALCDISDRLIVDTTSSGDPLRSLADLARTSASTSWRGQAADIAWDRVEPWREAVASFFDAPRLQPGLEGIESITITAGGPTRSRNVTAAGAYLAGWLAARLDWIREGAGQWHRADGGPVDLSFATDPRLPAGEVGLVHLRTRIDDTPASFVAQRLDAAMDLVLLTVEGPTPCPPPWKIKLPARDDAALLCGLLQRRPDDPMYAAALGHAARMD